MTTTASTADDSADGGANASHLTEREQDMTEPVVVGLLGITHPHASARVRALREIEGVEVGKLRRTYADVPTGGLLAYVGSGGQVEIGVRDGSASRRLGIGVGGKVRGRLG